MHAEQRKLIEKRYRVSEWHGRSKHRKKGPKGLHIETWKIPGWLLQRMRRDDLQHPRAVHSIWRHEETASVVAAVDAFACPSVEAAHDHLIEVLGAFGSDTIERQAGKRVVGDVAFCRRGTVFLFARANLVVFIRSVGPDAAPVDQIALHVDKLMERIEG